MKRAGQSASPTDVDQPRFDDVYRDHVQSVARWAARLAGPTVEAEDIVQEVFMIAHRQLAQFRGDARVSTWLFSITQNVVRHRRRRETVRRWLSRVIKDDAHDPPLRPTPVEDLERREATESVYKALAGMPDKYRAIFILFEIEGLSSPEIAQLTGLPATTLRVQLHRARAQFAHRLKDLGLGGNP